MNWPYPDQCPKCPFLVRCRKAGFEQGHEEYLVWVRRQQEEQRRKAVLLKQTQRIG